MARSDRIGTPARIRARRLERKLTQQKLADTIGTCRSYVTDVELGRRSMTLRSLDRFAAALKCRPRDLVD